MKDNTLFKQTTISKFKKLHEIFLWGATCVLIAGLIIGAILIFADGQFGMLGKVQGTLFFLATMAFISVNNFIRIEKGNKLIQGAALASFVANIVWVVLGILLIWEVFSPIQYNSPSVRRNTVSVTRTYDTYDLYDYDDYDDLYDYDEIDEYDDIYETERYDRFDDYDDYTYGGSSSVVATPTTTSLSVVAKITIIALSVASAGFWISNILSIKDKAKVIKPLKITAIVCQTYCCIFAIILVFINFTDYDQTILKFIGLAGLAESGFIITALAAWIISRTTHAEIKAEPVEEKPAEKIAEEPVIETTVEITETKESEISDFSSEE